MIRSFTKPVMLFCALLFAGIYGPANAQSYVSEANSNGFTLKKVVSDTAIASGQNFSYTIYFSIPAGATNVTITDALPGNVTFQAIATTSVCGSPTITTPTVGTSGPVSLSWASLPAGCSGSFVVSVQFPNGITCNGASARNNVCMTADLGAVHIDFCTGFVLTRAIAANPWNIGKWVIGAGTQPGPCPYVTADSIITYQVCVYKNVGTTGQLNLANAVVTDTLPAGATLVGSSCGAVQSGNVITWTIGPLSALPMYNTVCCTFQVLYPPGTFPTGTQIKNHATLSGILGSANNPCGQLSQQSAETCVEIKLVTSNTLSKYVVTNGQPGCAGMYRVWVCNNGTLPIASMTITDTIPAPLTGLSLGTVSPGLAATMTGNIVTVTLSSPLLPGQCRYFEVNFTIPLATTVGTVITNCAYSAVAGSPTLVACATFTVTAPAPNPCLWKEVCNEQPSYSPGNIFRYRLRVQNIGGVALTGASINDVLNPNLEYVGNPSYYTTSTWSAPCQTASNWSGVVFSQAGNSLTWTLPSIPAVCQSIFYGNCGMYGTSGVPYYFIEFDVKVKDTSALGNIPNSFVISGGNLTGPITSNIELVNVVGTAGFILNKSVSKDTTNWAASVNTTAGSNVNFKLEFTVAPGSVGLRHITFADLLPINDPPNDKLILGPCSPRGSAFNIGFNAPVSTVPFAAGYKNPTKYSNVNIFTPAGAPGPMFTSSCGLAGAWAPGIIPLDQNLGWYFGSAPIGAGNSATTVFNATVGNGAKVQEVACNTFAANAAVRHLINSVVYTDQVTGNLESGQACVNIVQDTGSSECFTVVPNGIASTGTDAAGNCTYDIIVTITNSGPATTGYFESFSGIVNPALLLIPNGITTDTISFIDTPPADVFICIRYGIDNGSGDRRLCDSLCIDLPPCGPSSLCDSLRAQLKSIVSTGVDVNGNCTYSVDFSFSNSSSNPILVWFDSFSGTVAPLTLNIPTGPSTQTVTFTDTPPADIFACIRYGIFQGPQPGQRVVCDSVCFDLPPCGGTTGDCDSLRAQFKSVTATGVDAVGNCTYSVDLTVTNSSLSPYTVSFSSLQGTVAPATATIPVGTSTQTFTFTDTPPANTFICIRFGFVIQGALTICDSVCFDLPPCGTTGACDSISVLQKSISAIGPNAAGNCTYAVSLVMSNSSASAMTLSFDSFQGTVAPGSLTIPTGTSSQSLTFTDTPPANTFICIRYSINIGSVRTLCDSVCFDIKPCDTKPCDSLSKADLDTVCCDYTATIMNVNGSPITSISYYIAGGTLNHFTTLPCTPVSAPAVGSASGYLNYSPPCPGNMAFNFQATPTTPSNVVTVTLVVHHGQDSCTIRFTYRCDPTPLQHCDDVKVKPFITPGQAVSGRAFTIMNAKVPASPISYVTITPIPAPCSITGSALMVDFTATAWSSPYSRIPATGFISANMAVSFNLTIPHSCNWTGNVQIVVHHADGDSCIYTYGPWKAVPGIGVGVVLTDHIDKHLFANKLSVRNPAGGVPVKWVSINVESPSDVIMAGSGALWQGTTPMPNYERLEGYEQGSKEALFTFESPIAPGRTSSYFNIVIGRDTAATGTPIVRWTTYDVDGNALATDTVGIRTAVLSVNGGEESMAPSGMELLHFFPNPASQSATVNYALGKSMHVHLELYNQLGESVATLGQGFETQGVHSAKFDTSTLPAGMYYVKLSSPNGHITKPLVIAR